MLGVQLSNTCVEQNGSEGMMNYGAQWAGSSRANRWTSARKVHSMEGILQALNDNAGTIQVVFSALVTLATLVYAVLTWRLVTETRRMRRAQTDAKVAVGLDSRPEYRNFVELFVRNEGVGPAYDVRFTVEMLDAAGDDSVFKTVQSLGFVEKGLDYFSPGHEIRSFLTTVSDEQKDYEAKMATRIRVRTSYRSGAGDKIGDTYALDFSVFKGLRPLGEPDLHSIANSLKAIAGDLGHIGSGDTQPHVVTQDVADYRRELQESLDSAREAQDQQPASADVESPESSKANQAHHDA